MTQYWISAADGSVYQGDMRMGDRAAAAGEISAWQSVHQPPVILDFIGFISLFTSAEQAEILSSTDPQTKLLLAETEGMGAAINLADARVVAGINYLATPTTSTPPGPGILTSARAAQILANQPHP